jgi:hypothetical protein
VAEFQRRERLRSKGMFNAFFGNINPELIIRSKFGLPPIPAAFTQAPNAVNSAFYNAKCIMVNAAITLLGPNVIVLFH